MDEPRSARRVGHIDLQTESKVDESVLDSDDRIAWPVHLLDAEGCSLNPFEVGNLEPHEPPRQLTVGPRRLFWLLMVIIAGLTLGLIVLFVLGLLLVRWTLIG